MVRKMLVTAAATVGCAAAVLLGSSAPAYAGPICAEVTINPGASGETFTEGSCTPDTPLVTTHDQRTVYLGQNVWIDVSLTRP